MMKENKAERKERKDKLLALRAEKKEKKLAKKKSIKNKKPRQHKRELLKIRRKTLFNKSRKSEIKTVKKKIVLAPEQDKLKTFQLLQSKLDKLVSKGIIHLNKANRIKVRAYKKVI